MRTIILTTCNTLFEAHLIKGMLENNDIKCFLTNENFSSLMPQYNGVLGAGINIVVDESDFEKAQNLIIEQDTKTKIECPNCQSTNIKFGLGTNKIKKIITVIMSLFFWIPFGNIRHIYYCQDCKTEFKLESGDFKDKHHD
jgi:hypothetical protein